MLGRLEVGLWLMDCCWAVSWRGSELEHEQSVSAGMVEFVVMWSWEGHCGCGFTSIVVTDDDEMTAMLLVVLFERAII